MNDKSDNPGAFRSGTTKELHIVTQAPSKWTTRLMKLAGSEYASVKDLVYHDGQYFFAGQRKDRLWVAHCIDTRRSPPDDHKRSKLYRQILGHQVGGGQALFVGFPDDDRDNFPRVVWGMAEGKPYDAIDHENLSWADGEPYYVGHKGGKICVVRGEIPGKFYDEIVGNLDFVANRILYRSRLGGKTFLVWGADESEPCDDISKPRLVGKEIEAWGTKNLQLCRITHKLAA